MKQPSTSTQHISSYLPPSLNGREFYEPPQPPRPPERVRLDSLDTAVHPQLAQAVKMARAWAARKRDSPEASLILCGSYGIGKTHIAKSILWSMCYAVDKKPVAPIGRFFVANDLIQSLEGDTYVRDLVGSAPIVVIDDAGSEQVMEYVKDYLQEREKQARYFKVIDYCYTYRISVIITSNLQVGELRQVVGGRSWDRLVEMCPKLPDGDNFIVDMFDVPSYRVKASGR